MKLLYFSYRISNNGGTIINRKIESLEELCGEYDIIFNCTGFRAGKLCNDVNVLPIRGQVIRVKYFYCNFTTHLKFILKIVYYIKILELHLNILLKCHIYNCNSIYS